MKLNELRGHKHRVIACTVDKRNKKLLSGSWDKTIIYWDAECGIPLVRLAGRVADNLPEIFCKQEVHSIWYAKRKDLTSFFSVSCIPNPNIIPACPDLIVIIITVIILLVDW